MSEGVESPRPGRSAEAIESSLSMFGRRNIGVLLQQLARDFERRARTTLRARGHTELLPSHQVVFAGLGRTGTRLTVLAQNAGMTKQAMGQIVDDLEQLGYVERTPDPGDGRAKIVRFTPAGLDFVCDAAEVLDGIWREYSALLGARELDQLQDTLHKLLLGTRRDLPTNS
jgi:MarR family transcriptional regulator, temperature-dependent positive regulator of motility